MTTTAPAKMRILDAAETAGALPWHALVDALGAMMLRRKAGRTVAPERLVVPLTGGTLLAMPAADGEYASTKLVTVHAGNPARGLPSLLGEVLLMRADTGERLAMLDGPTLTARRTAALSVLGARTLAPGLDGPMLIVGAGAQARGHLEAFASVLGVRDVTIASRSAASREGLAAHARAMGLEARTTDDPTSFLSRTRIVVTATTSMEPVFDDGLRDDAFVAAVGAYRPEMCELPEALVDRARLFVDDPGGARHEAGDLIRAGVDWARVVALEDVVAGEVPTPVAGPIVFKSVGQALWDLAAARLAIAQAGDGGDRGADDGPEGARSPSARGR